MRRHPLRSLQTSRGAAPSDAVSLIQSYDSELNPSRPVRGSPLGSSTDTGLPLELLDRLKAFPLFSSAPESFLLSIGRSLRPSIYQPAQEIIREGEDAKAMYWLVRGSVRVTSRDGESTYAELKPGAFFGEIGILMDMPRTASIVASIRSLVVRLNKEDLQKQLPSYPDVERAIRDEALERLSILKRKKKEQGVSPHSGQDGSIRPPAAPRKRSRDWIAGDVEMGEAGSLEDGEVTSNKKRKSPSPGIAEVAASSGLGSSPLTVRQLLKELPLFSGLPADILHFLGVNAQPVSYPPFTEIVKQGSSGREVYFIIKGDVEVLTEVPGSASAPTSLSPNTGTNGNTPQPELRIRARLTAGQYFGEVTSLSLSPGRTATVRSVNAVECLLINGDVLDSLWRRCSPHLRQQVESEAKRRLTAARKDDDVVMADVGASLGQHTSTTDATTQGVDTSGQDDNDWRKDLPTVKFEEPLDLDGPSHSPTMVPQMEPIDPDPFFNENLDNMRAKSRRSSLAPPLPPADGQLSALTEHRTPSPPSVRVISSSPLKPAQYHKLSPTSSPAAASPSSSLRLSPVASRRPSLVRSPSNYGQGKLPDSVLVKVLKKLDLAQLMRCRQVSGHWHQLISNSAEVITFLDLAKYNRCVTDEALRDVIVPFIGNRPTEIDMSNCFHVTDEGFKILTDACGESARVWKMKSVWDVTAPAVLALVEKAKQLEEIDLSNCRKVGDNLLARVVGWVVPETKPGQQPMQPSHPLNGKRPPSKRHSSSLTVPGQDAQPPPPGTVVGAPKLKRLTLSYCKHVQDRSMAHIAIHAADRLESLDLTRCTSISDAGFHSWGVYDFRNLKRLVLADCTYLSDQAIVGVVGGCRGLRELDLSFCCALSDTATEVLSLGLPQLRKLDMAFCGSAVSDNSLRCIGLHLLELRYLSVRGCVRVTGVGVESVVEGCRYLEFFDVSQCKNLRPWLERGGVQRVNGSGARNVRFDIVADGSWRTDAR
ncbi:F-box/LRR-repeat protein 7 [Fulvia fulva]|uniref:F-box/LRR-repeat protein 7 n=1 Tax=Passalora fulva TaxID=5499 RepID=A0A9Q8LET4_PASFU|nr:F-box/LRR-repeat protein 7 [Fulvia fulva]KAK4626342.1 F-box/LRR-repeat protein 7 [Fulvia fulva]KAK4627844.1 F-box/LRR-repeat protein 7 [Fulvia fulva]UJO16236.1 F-box/LRR-repeat protein 7 [Fulvia fulva]WPV13475.1 F-box/LRR-repeat protein 7 [Fulvia fulva]WPV28177.1 F-box/LRR-repeat protein 7 [Fulvia fulva]